MGTNEEQSENGPLDIRNDFEMGNPLGMMHILWSMDTSSRAFARRDFQNGQFLTRNIFIMNIQLSLEWLFTAIKSISKTFWFVVEN